MNTKCSTPSVSRTEQLLKSVRRRPFFHDLIPMEAGLAWPVPLAGSQRATVLIPCHGFSKDRAGFVLLAPFATITLDWQTGRLIEFVDLRVRKAWQEVDFVRPIGRFPHPAVQAMTEQAYHAQRRELWARFDQLLDTLVLGGELPPFWCRAFTTQLNLLLEPCLKPFYQRLAPKFANRFLAGGERPDANKPASSVEPFIPGAKP